VQVHRARTVEEGLRLPCFSRTPDQQKRQKTRLKKEFRTEELMPGPPRQPMPDRPVAGLQPGAFGGIALVRLWMYFAPRPVH
jgi:hypothetical protein